MNKWIKKTFEKRKNNDYNTSLFTYISPNNNNRHLPSTNKLSLCAKSLKSKQSDTHLKKARLSTSNDTCKCRLLFQPDGRHWQDTFWLAKASSQTNFTTTTTGCRYSLPVVFVFHQSESTMMFSLTKYAILGCLTSRCIISSMLLSLVISSIVVFNSQSQLSKAYLLRDDEDSND